MLIDSLGGNAFMSVVSRKHRDVLSSSFLEPLLEISLVFLFTAVPYWYCEVDCEENRTERFVINQKNSVSNGYMDIYWFPFLYAAKKIAVFRGQTITSFSDLHIGAMEPHHYCGSKCLAALHALHHSQLMKKKIAFNGGNTEQELCMCIYTHPLSPSSSVILLICVGPCCLSPFCASMCNTTVSLLER